MSVVEKVDYKETEIGWIPETWDVVKLGELCSLITKGTTPTTLGYEYQQAGVNFIKVECVDNYGRIDLNKVAYIDIETHDALNRSKLVCGDILYSIAGAIGRSAIVKERHLPANTNQALALIRLAADVNAEFLRFCLSSERQLNHISQISVSSAQANISLKDVSSFDVALPPLPEQKKIAAILTVVDAKLDVIARQIVTTKTLKQGLMQTWFCQCVGRQDASEWPTISLHEVAAVRTGVAKGKKGLKEPVQLPYLRVANVQDGHIDLSEVKTIEVEPSQIQRYALQAGDVLMTEGGDFDKLGRGDVWGGQISPCLHQNHVFAVRPNPEKLDSYYLAALAASDYGRQYFLSCAKRTTNLASINSTQLKAFPVLLPSLAEQQRIAEIVNAINARIGILEAKQTHYQTLKRGLMQKLLTGEWRVKLDVEAAHGD